MTDSAGNVINWNANRPYGEEWQVGPAGTPDQDKHRFTGKETDRVTGLSYFGARYYDPEVGRFTTVDPAEDGANWYAYCRDNPLVNVDPDGKSTYLDSYGYVIARYNDDDLNIYKYSMDTSGFGVMGPPMRIGETYFWNTFSLGDKLYIGNDITDRFMQMAFDAMGKNVFYVGYNSRSGKEYDVKTQWDMKPSDGVMFMGKYCTMEDVGNALAGINARTHDISFDSFQRMAGALHRDNGWFQIPAIILSDIKVLNYGPAPYYGELELQYRMSCIGYEQGYWMLQNYIWMGKVE